MGGLSKTSDTDDAREKMNEGKISCLEGHKKDGDIVKLILVYPDTKPIFKKGKVIEVFEDSFLFNDIIDGQINLSYSTLSEIKLLEKGNATF